MVLSTALVYFVVDSKTYVPQRRQTAPFTDFASKSPLLCNGTILPEALLSRQNQNVQRTSFAHRGLFRRAEFIPTPLHPCPNSMMFVCLYQTLRMELVQEINASI